MSPTGRNRAPSGPPHIGWLGYALIAGSVWVAWEVAKSPFYERAPPDLAVRLAPGSPEVLRRVAESELAANRPLNAKALANESLVRAPFNARALRVRGLSESALKNSSTANELLTLAGNWSLRDDPAHAWLIEHRLRAGNYQSAFAHADTLVRRRPDLHPRVFSLFTAAALVDARSLPVLITLLGRNPPWRDAYLEYLYGRSDGAQVIATLVVNLEKTDAPMSTPELQRLYPEWTATGKFAGLKFLREKLKRPPLGVHLANADFQTPMGRQLYPFGWRAQAGPGVFVGFVEEDGSKDNIALRVEYDGFSAAQIAEQLILLDPGAYELTGSQRFETAANEGNLEWNVTCAETGQELARSRLGAVPAGDVNAWKRFSLKFNVPATRCSAQWLRLNGMASGRRHTVTSWFDDLEVKSAEREN